MKRIFIIGVLILVVVATYSFAQMDGFGFKRLLASNQEVKQGTSLLEIVSAEKIYPLFVCPCCGQPLDKNKICCGLAKERIDYIDSRVNPVRKLDPFRDKSLTGQGQGFLSNEVKTKTSKDDIILAYVQKYGLSSFKDEVKQEEFKQKLAEMAPQVRPQIVIEPPVYDFGQVSPAKGVISTALTLKNEGKAPLVINNISTSCGCTSASIVYKGIEGPKFTMPGHGQKNPTDWSVSIAPGDEANIKIYYDPNMHKDIRGPITRIVSIFSNDPVDFEKKARIKLKQVE